MKRGNRKKKYLKNYLFSKMNQRNLEINFQRLLSKTTELAEKKDESLNWRLQKYVENLDEILKQLNKLTVK